MLSAHPTLVLLWYVSHKHEVQNQRHRTRSIGGGQVQPKTLVDKMQWIPLMKKTRETKRSHTRGSRKQTG